MRAIAIVVGAIAIPTMLDAQTPTWASYLKARTVLDSAAMAIGGVDALRNLRDVTRELSGIRTDVGQGPRPVKVRQTYGALGDMPPKVNAPRITSVRDYAGGRAYDRLRDTIYGGSLIDIATVIAPPARFSIYYDYISNGLRTSNPANLPNHRAGAFRRYPEGILRAALNRLDAIRWIGEAEFEGRKQNVIHFNDSDGGHLSLYFDAATHLLTKAETIGDDAIHGDVSNETVYLDYRPVGALKLPFRYVDRSAGFILQDLRATSLTADTKPSDSLFVKPAGVPELPESPGGIRVEKLSDDAAVVWGGGYNSIAFAFADHVLVLEAGANSGYAAQALSRINATFPNKPVRYVVATHWNFDHLGGLRPYVAAGTTIVTTPMTKTVLDGSWDRTHTLRRDALTSAPRPAKFELVTRGKRTFTDGTRVVEIFDVSPNPHVDEMLVAYLPKEKVLFEADLFDIEVLGHEGTGGADTEFLLKWIEKTKLDVQKIVPVHGVAATMDDLRKSVARRTAQP
jgi:glyoxylase-like metal-dependent hydrolase (beta-lactamase superfamily II)